MASLPSDAVVDTGIHTEIQVMVTDDHLCLFPVSSSRPDTPKEAIIFDRATQNMLIEPLGPAVEKYSSSKPPQESMIAFGILGIINLHSGLYVMVIKKRTLVGLFDGQCIYKVAEPAIFRVSNKGSKDAKDDPDTASGPSKADSGDKKRDENYVRILRTLLKSKDFYYSYTADVSNTLARKNQQPDSLKTKPLWMRWEDRVWCNRVISSLLIDNKLHEWVLPVMRGIVQIFVVVVQKQPFDFILISRRSRFRAGTRYKTRGVDPQGQVANYVETEEIVSINGHWMSFVQVRGSIPLVWEQTGRKYTPIPKISPDTQANASYFSRHFSQQIALYQRQVIVNLLDQKGVESELGSMYEDFCRTAQSNGEDLALFSFDFHEKCKTSYDNVSELMRSLSPELERMGLFHRDSSGRVVSNQIGTVRTNCLDCLDRTNLVQSFIGRYFMMKMLRTFNVAWDEKENIILEKIFKEAWASNGDAVSLQYAGTGALKSDFTRTGKRQTKGVMKDGVNSLSRYYINIFKDTLRQAAIDLFYGTHGINQTKVLEEDVLQQRGLWNKAQYTAIEECTAFLEESGALVEDEVITHAWIIISINEMDVEQERVLVLTNKSLIRFKYNFNTSKIARNRHLQLSDISGVQIGAFTNKPNNYGFSLTFASSENKGQNAHIYCPLDYSRYSAYKTLNAIADAVREFTPGLAVEEKTMTRTRTVRGAVLNKFKLGMFNGKNKSKSSVSSSPTIATRSSQTVTLSASADIIMDDDDDDADAIEEDLLEDDDSNSLAFGEDNDSDAEF
jgi:hypothetical protein